MFGKENKKKYAIDYIPFIEFMKVHNFRDSHDTKEKIMIMTQKL